MASQECQYCYYWKGNHTTTKADCDKTGKYKTELLELILTFSESEANAYLEILHTIRSALKNCG